MKSKRVKGANTQAIEYYFSFVALSEIQKLKPSNGWNMDSLVKGQGDRGLVLGST